MYNYQKTMSVLLLLAVLLIHLYDSEQSYCWWLQWLDFEDTGHHQTLDTSYIITLIYLLTHLNHQVSALIVRKEEYGFMVQLSFQFITGIWFIPVLKCLNEKQYELNMNK